jgi:hypothetical protein
VHTDPVRGCFDNPEGLNNGHKPSQHDPRVHELANNLRLGTAMLIKDLSGVWITMYG